MKNYSSLNTKVLIQKDLSEMLVKGDKDAINLIYKSYGDALYSIILKIVKSESMAEEVLQDTLVKVWKKSSTYNRSKGRIFTWLSQIARNTSIDFLRSRRFKYNSKIVLLENQISESKYGLFEIHIKDLGLANTIKSLKIKNRIIINLAYFQGYSQKEISNELGIPLGTVKSRLRRAISQLRIILKDERVQLLS
ncbi:MAG: RNA polymerase sigma factor [Saprospiraceae bacterium]